MACDQDIIQSSLEWCEGTLTIPGVRRRVYFIKKSDIVAWPKMVKAAGGSRPDVVYYRGEFTLKENATFKYIDILPDKSQLTSEPQGEYPCQTQLNKLVAVHPGIGSVAASLAVSVNNVDCVYLVEVPENVGGMAGSHVFRVLGNELWITKSTVNQDNGQGATGEASTTLNVEVSDLWPAPFYSGKVVAEDGTINDD